MPNIWHHYRPLCNAGMTDASSPSTFYPLFLAICGADLLVNEFCVLAMRCQVSLQRKLFCLLGLAAVATALTSPLCSLSMLIIIISVSNYRRTHVNAFWFRGIFCRQRRVRYTIVQEKNCIACLANVRNHTERENKRIASDISIQCVNRFKSSA